MQGFLEIGNGLVVEFEGVEQAAGLACDGASEAEVLFGGGGLEGFLEVGQGGGVVAKVGVYAPGVVEHFGAETVVVLVIVQQSQYGGVGGVCDVDLVGGLEAHKVGHPSVGLAEVVRHHLFN